MDTVSSTRSASSAAQATAVSPTRTCTCSSARLRPNAEAPLYDSYAACVANALAVTVARTIEDMLRNVDDELGRTHIGEQASVRTMRSSTATTSPVRPAGLRRQRAGGLHPGSLFRGFRQGRAAGRAQGIRNTRLSFQLVRAAIELCRTERLPELYGHAQKRW